VISEKCSSGECSPNRETNTLRISSSAMFSRRMRSGIVLRAFGRPPSRSDGGLVRSHEMRAESRTQDSLSGAHLAGVEREPAFTAATISAEQIRDCGLAVTPCRYCPTFLSYHRMQCSSSRCRFCAEQRRSVMPIGSSRSSGTGSVRWPSSRMADRSLSRAMTTSSRRFLS
jgi:hypothetical protein